MILYTKHFQIIKFVICAGFKHKEKKQIHFAVKFADIILTQSGLYKWCIVPYEISLIHLIHKVPNVCIVC